MYKVLVFMESEIFKMEGELNQYKDYDFIASWTTNTKLIMILKERPKAGRPSTKKEILTEE
jgi:hypothetical protein